MNTCKFFLKGNCRFGNLCHYKHDDPYVVIHDNQRVKRLSRPACYYFNNGYCRLGYRCDFKHIIDSNCCIKSSKPRYKSGVPAKSIDGVEILTEIKRSANILFRSGELKRTPLKPESQVWVVQTSVIEMFTRGTVIALFQSSYQVRVDDGKERSSNLYDAKQLAYREICPTVIPVGTRVIANSLGLSSLFSLSAMFAGVVAEVPNIINNNRYLLFFDQKVAQYTEHEDIRVVCSQNQEVWRDIKNFEVSAFIQNYLTHYPEKHLLRKKKNQVTVTEYNGESYKTEVLKIDGSMMLLRFVESGREEWIYRGCPRLKELSELNSS